MNRRSFLLGSAALALVSLGNQSAPAIEFIAPTSTPTLYDAYSQALLRQIAASLGIPYDLLTRDWEA